MPEYTAARRHGGRHPDAARDAALREAALALLSEVGYDGMTVDAVAARAKAGKNTIYRRWSGKAELVIDALSHAKGDTEYPDTGSLSGDLHAVADALADTEGRIDARVILGIAHAMARDTELRRVFEESFVTPHTAGLRRVFDRAAARGEIPADRDRELLASVFPALTLQELLVSGAAATPEFARRLMDEVVFPLATAPTRTAGDPHP
ncbi:TetR/AcrR family transcriptional regulator [Streptomonospora litoralis]|uniref:Transcriptional regulator, TetR family n=1 Tax=Streptomonospora litoralis TaxID=2498135 RepID=A0A4P6Q8W7_9ACTN|nr:TetR/AcrR family transcriptional regulator [Streptomonospora litoralis]QBI55709.1 Transcriptional regulator, TetR family [Streptomonospora litoralis]